MSKIVWMYALYSVCTTCLACSYLSLNASDISVTLSEVELTFCVQQGWEIAGIPQSGWEYSGIAGAV